MVLSSQLFASFLSVLTIGFFALSVHAQLDPDLPELNLLKPKCSRECRSEFYEVPPLLRYGQFCGVGDSGCPGESPCDDLDGCCMQHDHCIRAAPDNFLNKKCNSELKTCVESFNRSGAQPFKGNTCNIQHVVKGIIFSMDIATLPGKVIKHP